MKLKRLVPREPVGYGDSGHPIQSGCSQMGSGNWLA